MQMGIKFSNETHTNSGSPRDKIRKSGSHTLITTRNTLHPMLFI